MRPVPLAKKIKIKNTTKFLCSSFVLITLIGCAELEAKFVWLGRQDGLLVGHKNKGNWTRWQHLLMTQIGDCSKTLEKLMANTCCLHNFIAWFPDSPLPRSRAIHLPPTLFSFSLIGISFGPTWSPLLDVATAWWLAAASCLLSRLNWHP